MMKKLLSLLLALAMVLSLASCGESYQPVSGESAEEPAAEDALEASAVEDPVDEETSAEDTAQDALQVPTETVPLVIDTGYKVAMLTDQGDVNDRAFNQTIYEACRDFCKTNGLEFDFYQPIGASTSERVFAAELAIADGYNVIVLLGKNFAGTIVEVSGMYPEVKFVALDVSADDILEASVGVDYGHDPDNWDVTDYYNAENVYCASYQEELCGYMAGYAAVKLGYKHLGFLGGEAVPAVIRFGYGFVQGVNDAAKELGIASEVTVEYVYGNRFSGDADITAYMDNWYRTLGVEVVFACGGGIYASAAEAAAKVDGKVIGVDTDQAFVIDTYGEGMAVTSAMEGLAPTVNSILSEIVTGNWDSHAGKIEKLGLVSGDDPGRNYIQLPLESTQWSERFTREDYVELVGKLYAGQITVSDSTTVLPALAISFNEYGNIK